MKDYHKSAIAETLLIIFFTVLPTIFGIIKLFFSNTVESYEQLYKSGEFFLYAVSLLGSSFIVFNQFRIKRSDNSGILMVFTIICIVLFSLGYTGINNIQSTNINKIRICSFFAFAISVPLFLHSQVLSNKHSPDIGQQRRDEQETIENALN